MLNKFPEFKFLKYDSEDPGYKIPKNRMEEFCYRLDNEWFWDKQTAKKRKIASIICQVCFSNHNIIDVLKECLVSYLIYSPK